MPLVSEDCRFEQPTTLQANRGDIRSTLKRNEQEVMSEMFDSFGNGAFLRHHAQEFDKAPLINAYRNEDENRVKNVRTVAISDVPRNANLIGSQTI